MSVFRREQLPCPTCGTPVEFELVLSVNADRRPDLRDAIADNSFQRETCPSCGTPFRVEPEFTLMDLGRRQFVGVWPLARRAQWKDCAARTQQTFDLAFGSGASPEARKLGENVEARVVFGWPALVEKVVARAAGIDDRSLEMAKVAVLRGGDETPVPGERELRLVQVTADELLLVWVRPLGGEIGEVLRVPRALIGEIEAEPEAWQALREEVGEGLVVDFQRDMLPP